MFFYEHQQEFFPHEEGHENITLCGILESQNDQEPFLRSLRPQRLH